ncbi:hypothetical protein E3N88_10185 [Mikania micrantha]|uniref:Uncharacterized protein n=1 Tax=Mikania micrantha TaxID=192012 RepID=A0A5N6PBP8_9ASTR|nr:hypothetical protein E3N88_10185 [Mikania micrantha]
MRMLIAVREEAKQRFLKEDLAKFVANGLNDNAYGKRVMKDRNDGNSRPMGAKTTSLIVLVLFKNEGVFPVRLIVRGVQGGRVRCPPS